MDIVWDFEKLVLLSLHISISIKKKTEEDII